MKKSKLKRPVKNASHQLPGGPSLPPTTLESSENFLFKVLDLRKEIAKRTREIAELNTGIYDTRPYEFREKLMFIIALLFSAVLVFVLFFLIYIGQYSVAVGALGLCVVYFWFLATFYSRQPVDTEASVGSVSIKMKKEGSR